MFRTALLLALLAGRAGFAGSESFFRHFVPPYDSGSYLYHTAPGWQSSGTTRDGGFVMAEWLIPGLSHHSIAVITRFESLGQPVWRKSYGREPIENLVPFGIFEHSSGDIVVYGFASSMATPRDTWVMRVDPEGGLKWSRRFRTPRLDRPGRVIEAKDGGFFVVGEMAGRVRPDDIDGRLIRLDGNGDVIWDLRLESREFPDPTNQALSDVTLLPDGGIVAIGLDEHTGHRRSWLIRVDADGTLRWSATYAIDPYGWRRIVSAPSGKTVIAFVRGDDVGDAEGSQWTEIDTASGEVVRSRISTGPGYATPFAAAVTNDGGLLLLGGIVAAGGIVWVARFEDGQPVWSRVLNSNPQTSLLHFDFHELAVTPSNGLVATGTSVGFGISERIVLLRMDAEGRPGDGCSTRDVTVDFAEGTTAATHFDVRVVPVRAQIEEPGGTVHRLSTSDLILTDLCGE